MRIEDNYNLRPISLSEMKKEDVILWSEIVNEFPFYFTAIVDSIQLSFITFRIYSFHCCEKEPEYTYEHIPMFIPNAFKYDFFLVHRP